MLGRDRDFVYFDPAGMGHPLRGKALDVFHGVVGSIEEEFAYEMETFVVGDVSSGFLVTGFAIEVLVDFVSWQNYD